MSDVEFQLSGLRAVVTGSSSGIGRAIALAMAKGGADVIVHCRESVSAGDEVVREIKCLGRRSVLLTGDVGEIGACEGLVGAAWAVWSGVDVWVNNAGADTLTGDAAKLGFEAKLAELLAVDLTGTMVLSRAVGGQMRNAGGGSIINMGWDQAEAGMEGDSGELFAAVKGGIMGFTRSLAKSLAPKVRVNCLAPGWIRTTWGEGASAVWQERVLSETPLKRWGTPEDVAGVACFLASPAGAFVTGQIVRVNGGAVC
jgi:3-oxoacyl-[acyl-carrier protein] reductase